MQLEFEAGRRLLTRLHVRILVRDVHIRRRHLGVSAPPLAILSIANLNVMLSRYDPASAEYKQLPAAAAAPPPPPQQAAAVAQQQQQTQHQWTQQQWASLTQEQQQGYDTAISMSDFSFLFHISVSLFCIAFWRYTLSTLISTTHTNCLSAAWTIYYQQQAILQQQQQQAFLQQKRAPPPLHPPVAPPNGASKAAPGAASTVDEWPPSFKDFVAKCFATCTTVDNKKMLTEHLRTLTQQCKSNKTLHSTDWSMQPIINAVEIEAAERAKAASFKVPPPTPATEPKSWLQVAKKGASLKWGPEAGAPAPAPAIPPPPPRPGDISARLQFKPSKKGRDGSELDAPLTKIGKKQQKAEAAKGKKSFGAVDEGGSKPWKRGAYDATSALLDDIAANFITEVVKGTCEQLEKPYMRQQMQPLASEVRPERVLIRSIALMKERHAKGAQYDYISEQMKSIRQVLVPCIPTALSRFSCDHLDQDLVLQAIRNETTADASEFHSLVRHQLFQSKCVTATAHAHTLTR